MYLQDMHKNKILQSPNNFQHLKVFWPQFGVSFFVAFID